MNIIELRRKGIRLLALLLVWVLLLGCAAETTTQQSTEDQPWLRPRAAPRYSPDGRNKKPAEARRLSRPKEAPEYHQ